MKSNKSFLAGVGMGVGVGAILGLILAPKPGKEMQRSIAEGARKGMDQISEAGRKIRGQVQDLTGRQKEQPPESMRTGTGA